MGEPIIDTSKWRLQTLTGAQAGNPDVSIYEAFGNPNPFAMGMGGGAGRAQPTAPYQSVPQPNWGWKPTPPPPQSFGGTARNPFAVIANPFLQMAAWQKNIAPFIGGAATTQNPSAPGGNAGNSSMSAGEKRWADIAAKMGLNWQVTKDVYMNPHRNGSPNPAEALGRQMDDKIWGDVFMQATGHAPNQQEWIDHYNAGGNWAYDPLTGHNDAIAEIERRRAELEAQTNPQDYPDWYQPPQ